MRYLHCCFLFASRNKQQKIDSFFFFFGTEHICRRSRHDYCCYFPLLSHHNKNTEKKIEYWNLHLPSEWKIIKAKEIKKKKKHLCSVCLFIDRVKMKFLLVDSMADSYKLIIQPRTAHNHLIFFIHIRCVRVWVSALL